MTEAAEVLVAGMGPAGSALAARLAARGRDVLCLDAAEFPREKPCGDCLNPGAVEALARLGSLAWLDDGVLARPLRGWRISLADGRGFVADYGPATFGRGVRRRDLDAALVRFAESRGARVQPRARVVSVVRRGSRVAGVVARIDGRRTEVRARLVVGADGLRSVVAARLGLVLTTRRRRKVAFVAHLAGGARALDGRGELWIAKGRRHEGASCVGLAPLGDGSLNVTCVAAEDAGGGFRRAPGWRAILDEFPEVARRLAPYPMSGPVLATGPFDRPVRRAFEPGALLVGDAAGYYDPFTGEGIYRALRSAEIAEPFALDYLQTANVSALAEYARALNTDLRLGRALERVVEHVVSRPRAFAFAARALARSPSLARGLLRRIGDVPGECR